MAEANPRPRIGVPWRTLKEEETQRRDAYQFYLEAVRAADGEPVEISLRLRIRELNEVAATLDAILLPGSPADVDPSWYHVERGSQCGPADPYREQTDFALLDAAFALRKPVLAICYGTQSLNVYLGGRLIQDIPSEIDGALLHHWADREENPEPFHEVRIEADSRLGRLAGESFARVNSSHHQSIARAGRDLRIVASAPDGVVEAVEGTTDGHWVTGVQWHPERMAGDALATALFGEFVAAARRVPA